MSLLGLYEVSYTYPGGGAAALRELSLEIAPGELVVVAGASGSGKSTLLRAASGLVPHFYGGELAGRVIVDGMNTREHGPGQLAAAVGTLFQDPETQIVMGTVRAELAFGLENRGTSAAGVALGVEEAALALGISHLLDRSTQELSGGELQRVALGAALAGRPKLLVLDEPTSQLDPVAGDELITVLRRLNEDFDTTILLAEHRLERCLAAADRVIAMVEGRVACDAAPSRFLQWAAGAAPELQTPGAKLLSGLGLEPVPGVKAARAALRGLDLLPSSEHAGVQLQPSAGAEDERLADRDPPVRRGWRRRPAASAPALRFDSVWHEISGGPAILRDVSLTVAAGEKVALMGRNGAGKSTLLRHAAGLLAPTRGRISTAGRVALLLQNPTDYLVHDTVRQEASARSLTASGLDPAALADRHPRDLSGGEKQRLALAIVLGDPGEGTDPAAVVCLDEPTRGMDRAIKDELAAQLRGLDAAVLVATHDPEFVAAFSDRVVLLADGGPIADGAVGDVLAEATYFATETARILGGAGAALRPSQGLALISRLRARAVIA